MNRILLGALAGLAATAPMTLAMKLMHEQLPPEEKYPLPPRQVTEGLAEAAGVGDDLDEKEKDKATWVSHFAYGALSGALYGALSGHVKRHAALAGAGFGVAVWAGSYLGWLPAAGIITPATEHPPRRNALMITSHVVWGVTAALVLHNLADEEEDEESQSSSRSNVTE